MLTVVVLKHIETYDQFRDRQVRLEIVQHEFNEEAKRAIQTMADILKRR